MDICISVRSMDKCISIMAIPFHVPEGVGPIIDANNNTQSNNTPANQTRPAYTRYPQQGRRENRTGRVTNVPANSESPAATGIHQVELRDSTRINLQSFPRQLITELYTLYQSICVVPPQPSTTPITPFDSMASIRNRDNQGSSTGSRRAADQVVTGPQLPLPDIIQCHAGLGVDLTYRGCRVSRTGGNSYPRRLRSGRRVFNPRRSSNNIEHPDQVEDVQHHEGRGDGDDDDDDDDDEEELNSDWTLELKLLVGPWRQAGIELRAIADQYQLENSRRRRRSPERRQYQFRLLLNVAVPAAAALAWGISWLRRH